MSAAPTDKPAETVPSPPQAAPPAPNRPPNDPKARVFLAVSAALLFGWLAWLSYTALTKSRDPIVSRAQAAVATTGVVAKVDADEKGAPVAKVTVVDSLGPGGPPKDAPLEVENMHLARGFTGAGEYLLLLPREPHEVRRGGLPVFLLVGSRGTGTESDPPTIYRWTPDVAAQAKRMFRAKD